MIWSASSWSTRSIKQPVDVDPAPLRLPEWRQVRGCGSRGEPNPWLQLLAPSLATKPSSSNNSPIYRENISGYSHENDGFAEGPTGQGQRISRSVAQFGEP